MTSQSDFQKANRQPSKVGRSSRTPLKHYMLNAEVGRIVGVVNQKGVPAKAFPTCPLLFLDSCAGNGECPDGETCSPKIFVDHSRFAIDKKGIPVELTLIEKCPENFSQLKNNIKPEPWIKLILGDAREFRFATNHEMQAAFINADPNSISGMPITKALLDSCPRATTTISTFGCNVGGGKRAPWETRQKWYDYVEQFVDILAPWHDAIMVELAGDCSQWAYLITLPHKWTDETITRTGIRSKSLTEFDLTMASMRKNYKEWMEIQDRLFKTKAERGCA